MADKPSKKSITAKPVVTKDAKTKTVTFKTPDAVVSIKAPAAKKTAPAKKVVKPAAKEIVPTISPGAASLRKRTQELIRNAIPN